MNTGLLFSSQNPPIITGGLVGFWSCNEGSGVTLLDYSGNNYTGSFTNSTVSRRPGIIGGAINTSGTGYVYVGRPTVFNLPSFTCCMWYKPDSTSTIQSSIDCNNLATFGWALNLNQNGATGGASAGRVAFYAYIGGSFGSPAYSNGVVLSIGTWTHLATTFGGGNLTLYVNGSTVGNTNRTGLGAVQYNSNVLTFGRDLVNTNQTLGTMDEIHIYNRVLNASEILTLYNTKD